MGVESLKDLWSPISWGVILSSNDHILSFYLSSTKFFTVGMVPNRGKGVVEKDCIKWMELLKICVNRCKGTDLILALFSARKEIAIQKQEKAQSPCFHVFKNFGFSKCRQETSQFLWQLGVGWHFFACWNHTIYIKKRKRFLLPQASRFAFVPISTLVWSLENTERRAGSVRPFHVHGIVDT